jgi:hypothetical protein
VQECGIGLVQIRREGHLLSFAAPPRRKVGPLDPADVDLITRGLGLGADDLIDHAWCDNGPRWRGVLLRSAELVLALKPDAAILAGLDIGVVGPRAKVGVVGHYPTVETSPNVENVAFEVRAFFPGHSGMAEDPVTGSLNADSFQLVTNLTTGSFPINVKMGDMDGDGRLEVLATSAGTARVYVYKNNTTAPGSISLASGTIVSTVSSSLYGIQPQVMSLADFDQDGKLDISVACIYAGYDVVSVIKNNCNGNKTYKFRYTKNYTSNMEDKRYSRKMEKITRRMAKTSSRLALYIMDRQRYKKSY